MTRALSAFFAGCIFGAGLLIAQMTNPAKVIAFLDIFGNWDPSLALVMGSALIVTIVGYRIVFKSNHPMLDSAFHLPTRKDIDLKLVLGASIFGIGWGLGGLCPGPALSDLFIAGPDIYYFLSGFVAAVAVFRWRSSRKANV